MLQRSILTSTGWRAEQVSPGVIRVVRPDGQIRWCRGTIRQGRIYASARLGRGQSIVVFGSPRYIELSGLLLKRRPRSIRES